MSDIEVAAIGFALYLSVWLIEGIYKLYRAIVSRSWL